MINQSLIEQIKTITGKPRLESFEIVARYVMEHADDIHLMVETGCYRGNGGDGGSTKIFALLAREIGADFTSVDLDEEHVKLARQFLTPELLKKANIVVDDSVHYLSVNQRQINILYLDSYDYNAGDPLPCQMHQLAEFGAAYGKLSEHCLVLLDDNVEGTGGKTKLAAQFIESKGFTKIYENYQIIFTR